MVQIPTSIFSSQFRYQLLATLCVNIITFSHGITCGWYVPTLLTLQSDDSPLKSGKINLEELSWIGSLLCIGGLNGNLIFGFLLNKIGRKKAVLLLGIPQLCSWMTIIFGDSVYHIYAARILAGTTGGGIFTVFPIFIAEIADERIRGTLASMIMLVVNFGIFIGFIVGSYVPYEILPFIIVGSPLIYILTMFYFPETPQYLLESKKEIEAEMSYKFYKNFTGDTKEKFQQFNEDFENLKISIRGNGSSKEDDNKVSIKDFCTPVARKGIIIGVTLMAVSQFSGCFAIANYMANIFNDLGTNIDINMNTIIVGAVQTVGTYVSTVLVDRVGRKILLTISSFAMALGLAGLGLYAYFSQIVDLSFIDWLPVVCLSFAIFFGSIGIVPLPLVVMTEVVPLKIRSITSTFCMIMLSLLAFSNLIIYPTLIDILHIPGTMFISGTVCIFGAIFILTYVPETKGKSLSN